MSDSGRGWRVRVQDIVEAIREIQSFTEGLDLAGFQTDLKSRRAIELNFIIIGEAASAVPTSVQDEHPDIPWNMMRAMRNRIVHAYFDVDPQIVWETVHTDLPRLLAQLNAVLS